MSWWFCVSRAVTMSRLEISLLRRLWVATAFSVKFDKLTLAEVLFVVYFVQSIIYTLYLMTDFSSVLGYDIFENNEVSDSAVWIAGQQGVMSAMVLLTWQSRSMESFWDEEERLWQPLLRNPVFSVTKSSLALLVFWTSTFIVAWLLVLMLNVYFPMRTIFLSSLLCSSSSSCNTLWLFLSCLHHTFIFFLYFVALTVVEVAPMSVALLFSNAMRCINHDLAILLNTNTVSEGELLTITNDEVTGANGKCECVRRLLNLHVSVVQHGLFSFNKVYGRWLAMGLTVAFCMGLFLFYGLTVRGYNDVDGVVHGVGGLSIILRSVLQMHVLGGVKARAQQLKCMLLVASFDHEETDTQETDKEESDKLVVDASLRAHLRLFVSGLDQVAVHGDRFYVYSHRLVLSFVGFMATYVAILNQTANQRNNNNNASIQANCTNNSF